MAGQIVQRVAPIHPPVALTLQREKIAWFEQCGADLAAERHAVGCKCFDQDGCGKWGHRCDCQPSGACTHIVKCMVGFVSYDVATETGGV